jgi:hypothetical protein
MSYLRVCFIIGMLSAAGCNRPCQLPMEAEQRLTTQAILQSGAAAEVNKLMGTGSVEIKTDPAGATLYIDDGIFDGPVKALYIPVGAYDFKAVWPDGQTASRRVFVRPCLKSATSHVAWTQEAGQLKYEIVWDKFESDITRVELRHP